MPGTVCPDTNDFYSGISLSNISKQAIVFLLAVHSTARVLSQGVRGRRVGLLVKIIYDRYWISIIYIVIEVHKNCFNQAETTTTTFVLQLLCFLATTDCRKY